MKKLLALALIFLILSLIAGGWWNWQLSAVSPDQIPKTVIIAKGKSVNEIVSQLKKENLIRSTVVFSFYIRIKGLSSKLSAGTFNLSPAMSVPEIVKILQ